MSGQHNGSTETGRECAEGGGGFTELSTFPARFPFDLFPVSNDFVSGKECWQLYHFLLASPLTCGKVSRTVEDKDHLTAADHSGEAE